MPRVHLHVLNSDRCALGQYEALHERITALLEIGSQPVLQDCIIDTSAPLTVFPQEQWERFRDDIHWVDSSRSQAPLPDWLSAVTGIGAQPISCRLGVVNVRIIGWQPGRALRKSPTIAILAKFAEDGGIYKKILLGLSGGTFARWKFILDYRLRKVWLQY